MKKKILPLFLILTVLISIFPVLQKEIQAAPSVQIGDYIQFGSYYDEPILWRVINIDKDGDPLLFSDKIICFKEFDAAGNYHANIEVKPDEDWDETYNRRFDGSNYWKNSNIRQWLNGGDEKINWIQNKPLYQNEKGFLSSANFTSFEKNSIKPVSHTVLLDELDKGKKDGGSELYSYDISRYSKAYYQQVTDSVFLLSMQELQKHIIDRGWEYEGKPTQKAVQNYTYIGERHEEVAIESTLIYYLRDPEVSSSSYVKHSYGGQWYAAWPGWGVRPALYINLSSALFKSGSGTKANPYIATGGSTKPSSWAAIEIEKAKENNLTTEHILSEYQSNITREEFCELVVKLYEALSGTKANLPSQNKFSDTNNPEILKANQVGIVDGISETIFAPNNNVTREQMAVMLNNLLNVLEMSPVTTMEYVYFSDEEQISSWAKSSIQLMNKVGIIGGVGDHRINPKGKATREQAIALVNRTYQKFILSKGESTGRIEDIKVVENVNGSNEEVFNDSLTENEKELAILINQYRKSLNLKPLTISKSLTKVARTHVKDSNLNHPENGTDVRGVKGNLHSWSDQGSWKPVCYTSDHKYSDLMWSKPSELTQYKGSGFEISLYSSGTVTPKGALGGWKSSSGHNAVIIGEGYWSNLNTMGIGIDGNYSHVWFGMEDDSAGYYSLE